jgi:hypothetical protein
MKSTFVSGCKLPFEFTKAVHRDLDGKEFLVVGVGIRVMGDGSRHPVRHHYNDCSPKVKA